jgi:hypothetical protein
VFQLGSGSSKRLEVEHGELEHRVGAEDGVGIGGVEEAGVEFWEAGAAGREGGAGKEAGVDERWWEVVAIMEEQGRVVGKVEGVEEGAFFSRVSGSSCSFAFSFPFPFLSMGAGMSTLALRDFLGLGWGCRAGMGEVSAARFLEG